MTEVGVIIPYYHKDLSELEKISYLQCKKILGQYPIILLIPDSMSEEDYPKDDMVIIEKVPTVWLQSISTYNAMMLNIEFYKRFQEYKYILIYQLDAFVFSDRLMEFCNYNYDYIGAPWLAGYFYYISEENCIWNVGNGGFSLRKVQSFINLLLHNTETDFKGHEDFFYAISQGANFKVAPIEIALQFSFEQEVKKSFALNNQELPFGCHAWEKYDLQFWTSHIEKYGYCIDEKYSGKKDEQLEEEYRKRRVDSYFWKYKFSINMLKNNISELLSKKIDNYFIWGAGYYGKLIYKMFSEANLTIKRIIDNNPDLLGKKFYDVEIEDKENCILGEKEALIIAIKNPDDKIDSFLLERGYVYKRDYIYLADVLNMFN